MKTTFVLGDSKAVCDRCGTHYHQSDLRKEWTNLMVCDGCWEPRHPQDLIKPRQERNNIKDPRMEPAYRFLAVGEITEADL